MQLLVVAVKSHCSCHVDLKTVPCSRGHAENERNMDVHPSAELHLTVYKYFNGADTVLFKQSFFNVVIKLLNKANFRYLKLRDSSYACKKPFVLMLQTVCPTQTSLFRV